MCKILALYTMVCTLNCMKSTPGMYQTDIHVEIQSQQATLYYRRYHYLIDQNTYLLHHKMDSFFDTRSHLC